MANMKNKVFVPVVVVMMAVFSSCNLVSDLVPDVDTDFTKTFQVKIFSNTGLSDKQEVDVTTSSEYNDFKNNVEGYVVNKITYKIKNVNAPEDMYFNGSIVCSNEENTESYTIGTMGQANLITLETSGAENEVIKSAENIDKIITWLDSPGRFNVQAGYTLTKADGSSYSVLGIEGSNFEIVVKFYVTVKTKV